MTKLGVTKQTSPIHSSHMTKLLDNIFSLMTFCLVICLQPYFDLKGTNELMMSNEVEVVRKKLNNDILILLCYFLLYVPL